MHNKFVGKPGVKKPRNNNAIAETHICETKNLEDWHCLPLVETSEPCLRFQTSCRFWRIDDMLFFWPRYKRCHLLMRGSSGWRSWRQKTAIGAAAISWALVVFFSQLQKLSISHFCYHFFFTPRVCHLEIWNFVADEIPRVWRVFPAHLLEVDSLARLVP